MNIFDKKFSIFYGLLIAWRISAVCSIKGRVCHSGKAQFLPETAQDTTKRLADLRSLMSEATLTGQEGGVQAYIIPSSDPHQTEDVAAEHERREFISGFTGSHGTAIVTKNKAALWTDGRYFLQAEMELDCNWVLQKEGLPSTPKFGQWLKMNIPANSSVGVDPFLLSVCDWEKLSTKLKTQDIKLVSIKENLVDRIWTTRPTGNKKPIYVLGLQFTGMSWQDKVRDVRLQIQKKNVTAVVLQALDEIAWIFNLRGHDISYSPVFFSYSIITLNEAILFIDKQKVPKNVEQHLNTNLCSTTAFCVKIESYSSVLPVLQELAKTSDSKIWITPYSSYALRMVIPDDKYVSAASPVALPKAIKNDVEIQGMKNANIRDGVVISEFFAWLEREVQNQSPDLTEISAEEQLTRFREQQDNFISLSFATISGFGANSAIIHYKANNFTKVQITDKGFFLLDTGAQYKDGTTDTTRTVHFGQPKQHEIDSYTRVLMGHIDIAMAVFPNDTHGRTLDVFAREPLWRVGLDYRHGTGHGIGHFLNVHEGPQCISPGFPLEDERVLTKGMILSDEPGYYEDGQFGVRIETAVLVESANTPYNFNKLEYLKFEPIALVPFQRKLINTLLMKPSQIAWLNEYHSRTRIQIGAELRRQGKIQTLQWLIKETQTIPLPDYKPTVTNR